MPVPAVAGMLAGTAAPLLPDLSGTGTVHGTLTAAEQV